MNIDWVWLTGFGAGGTVVMLAWVVTIVVAERIEKRQKTGGRNHG